MKKKEFTFIDLFAGLGGFHLAMESLGGKCVFASELKEDLQELYKTNFPETPEVVGDITAEENLAKIPPHNILCAGFPCQPFSQAGKRQGFKDVKKRGNMFDYICRIVAKHRPEYLFLENVANLKGHDNGNTWNVIFDRLRKLRYDVRETILSPHQFGIPQHRKRIYIVCRNLDTGTLEKFSFPEPTNVDCDIQQIIDENDIDYTPLKPEIRHYLDIWQDFLDQLKKRRKKIPSFPIWSMEFGATYDFKESVPAYSSLKSLIGKKGQFGERITRNNLDKDLSILPKYARIKSSKKFPHWKIRYIEENRKFYCDNKEWLDEWLRKVKGLSNSFLKLEWNCGNDSPTLSDKIIQFRASGIRVKKPTFSPALNLIGTQIPIFPWVTLPNTKEKGRYMTYREAASLQGMRNLRFSGLSNCRIFEALGNAVNVTVVGMIAKRLIKL